MNQAHRNLDLQENLLTDIEEPEIEASQGQRILSNVIDLILEIGLLIFFFRVLPVEIRNFLINGNSLSIYITTFVWITLYRLILIFALQKTIGMILCRVKYLNEDLQPLSSGEKVIVTFISRTKKIKLYKA